jgi:hypothetical protein
MFGDCLQHVYNVNRPVHRRRKAGTRAQKRGAGRENPVGASGPRRHRRAVKAEAHANDANQPTWTTQAPQTRRRTIPPASPWSAFEAAYREVVSLDRLQPYRKDRDRAAWAPMIGRYMYNVELARALVPVLHWAEIALRNRLHG